MDLDTWSEMLLTRIRYEAGIWQDQPDRVYGSSMKTIGDILKFQDFRLEPLLDHCIRRVPYYRDIFGQNAGTGCRISRDTLYEFPVLTRDLIRKQYSRLVPDDIASRRWYPEFSGGSTGEPVGFLQDDGFMLRATQTRIYYHQNILGMDTPFPRTLHLWGSERDIFSRKRCLAARDIFIGDTGLACSLYGLFSIPVWLNSFRLTDADMENYIRVINSYKPDFIRGYAGSLYELCRYAEKNHRTLHTPDYIVSAAETLREDMRDVIERGFGTKVRNFYACREVSSLAGECSAGKLHTFDFWNVYEILDDEGMPVKEGEEGDLVVTNLFNYAMPLVRYFVGDRVVKGPDQCSCGSPLPTIDRVVGRVTDHFRLRDGTHVHGEYFTHLCYSRPWVKKFQVIQEDYDAVRILVVREPGTVEEGILDMEMKIRLVMGENCRIAWEFVDTIETPVSGKYRYTVSKVR